MNEEEIRGMIEHAILNTLHYDGERDVPIGRVLDNLARLDRMCDLRQEIPRREEK